MKMNSIAVGVFAAAVLAAAAPAMAQDISFNAGVTSDYISRGTSQTNHQTAFQGGVDVTYDSGFYIGAWGSNVDFGPGYADTEIDVYAGYRTEMAGLGLDFGVASYSYLNDDLASSDMLEASVTASRTFGSVGTTFQVAYSPDYFAIGGNSVWVEAGASVPLTSKLSLSGSVGYQDVQNEGVTGFPSYSTYNVGFGYALAENLALDVRYSDNDLDASHPAVGSFADDSFAVGLTASF